MRRISRETVVVVGSVGVLTIALIVSVWGALTDGNSERYIAIALSILLFEIILERILVANRLDSLLQSFRQDNPEPRNRTLLEDTASLADELVKSADANRSLIEANQALIAEALEVSRYSQESLEVLDGLVSPYFDVINSPGDTRFLELKLLYSVRGARRIDQWTLEVDRRWSIDLWRDCLIASRTWDAISRVQDLWERGERAKSHQYQRLQRELGQQHRIRRVFLVNSEKELETMGPVLQGQVEVLGITNVRWIFASELEEIARRSQLSVDRYGPIADADFAVANDAFVLRFLVEGNRLRGAQLTDRPDAFEWSRRLFDLAFDEGESVGPDPSV